MVICFKPSQSGIQGKYQKPTGLSGIKSYKWVKTTVEAYPLLSLNGPHVLFPFSYILSGNLFGQVLETSMISIWDILKVKALDFGRLGRWITHSLHLDVTLKNRNDEDTQKSIAEHENIYTRTSDHLFVNANHSCLLSIKYKQVKM